MAQHLNVGEHPPEYMTLSPRTQLRGHDDYASELQVARELLHRTGLIDGAIN